MPEMLRFCGRQLRVRARAHKACDTVDWREFRHMENAVHLEDLRCDGSAHDGCQAGCLIFWKEAWLSPVESRAGVPAPEDGGGPSAPPTAERGRTTAPPREALSAATRAGTDASGRALYSCQATELPEATRGPLRWWEPTQYVLDLTSGNSTPWRVARALLVGLFNRFQQANARLLSRLCLIRGCKRYPFIEGSAATGGATVEPLGLRPGDIVEIKSKGEIFETLEEDDTTQGLRFDSEMLHYCGQRARVLRRVEKIIDEKTGRMLRIKRDTVILDGVVCRGTYHRSCPRAIYPYWREAWLRKVSDAEELSGADGQTSLTAARTTTTPPTT